MVQKDKKKEERKLHPAAETWNAFLRKMEEAKELWAEHNEVYLRSKKSIGRQSLETQKALAGIVHQQKRFDYILDYMMKHARTGYLQLIIKE